MKVIVTRPRAQAGPLAERLEALGADVVECPLIEIERISDEPIDAAGYDWLVVTSAQLTFDCLLRTSEVMLISTSVGEVLV